jgi:Protein of unknown function (DUF2442)
MPHVTSVRPLDNYRLAIRFDDGVEREIALGDRLFGPVFEPLKDPALFVQVFVDEFGAVAWPNGADLAPDALHERFHMANSATSPA